MGWPMLSESEAAFAWSSNELAGLPGWRQVVAGRAESFARVVHDTRSGSLRGALFVAVRGHNHDGHDFVAEAVERGAAGVVVERSARVIPAGGTAVFEVADTLEALADLARMRRRAFAGRVVALTGSAGKTSTKHFVAAFGGRRVYVNPGNLNNRIGVPLSIFEAPLDADAWVLELGMNAPGEIASLRDCVEADLAVLLPAGRAHLGFLDGEAGVLAAKAELLEGPTSPERIILADHRYAPWLAGRRPVRVGTEMDADVRWSDLRERFPGGLSLRLHEGAREWLLQTGLHGGHWAPALAVAWAILRELGVPRRDLARRAEGLQAPAGRMELRAWRGGWILDDSYNASPESFRALMEWVQALAGRLQVRLLLGEMRELGDWEGTLHAEVAAATASIPHRWLGVVGTPMARALQDAGLRPRQFLEAGHAVAHGLEEWSPGSLLIVKGAHGTGLHAALCKALGER